MNEKVIERGVSNINGPTWNFCTRSENKWLMMARRVGGTELTQGRTRLLSANATQDECEQRDHRSGCCRSSGGSFIRMQSDNDAQPLKKPTLKVSQLM